MAGAVVFAAGRYVVLALGEPGFSMSIMFPTNFSLGIERLGEVTKPASALIVMSIIGGALSPVLMGDIIDRNGDNIQSGYLVPLGCYLVVLLFAMYGYKQRRTA